MAASLAKTIQVLHNLFIIRCFQVAPSMLLYYNYTLTFSDEVVLFWNRGWSVGHVLFVLIRYEPLGCNILLLFVYMNSHNTSTLCEVYGQYLYIIQAICMAFALQAILVLRLYGLYGSKKLVYVLSLFLIVTLSAEGGLAVKYSSRCTSVRLWQTVGNICVTNYPHKLAYSLLPAIVFHVLVFLLAAYKGAKEWLDGNLQRSRLLQILLRDSLGYFFIITALDIMSFVTWLHGWDNFTSPPIVLAVESILGTQMLMNIRQEAWRKTNRFSDFSTMPDLEDESLHFRRTDDHAGELISETRHFEIAP